MATSRSRNDSKILPPWMYCNVWPFTNKPKLVIRSLACNRRFFFFLISWYFRFSLSFCDLLIYFPCTKATTFFSQYNVITYQNQALKFFDKQVIPWEKPRTTHTNRLNNISYLTFCHGQILTAMPCHVPGKIQFLQLMNCMDVS